MPPRGKTVARMSNDNEESDVKSPELNSVYISESKEEETSSSSSAEETQTNSAVLVSSLIINQALENFSKGQQKEYDALVQKLGDSSLTSVHLRRYLKALRRCTSSLTKKCDILVGTILKLNWANADDETADEFVEFLMSLVSAQTYYLRACLRMLTKLFLPTIPKGVDPEDVNMEKQQNIFNHAHDGLQAILEIVPTTPKFLLPILSDNLPYFKKHSIYQTSYVKNLLHITQYLPSIQQDVLECVINHVTRIDVEVPRHELDEPEEEENTQFEVDLECIKKESTTEDDDESKEIVENEMAETLDQLMEILFKYIKEICFVDGLYHVDASTELFNQLIRVFDKIILPTHASCHVHFAIFYICSIDQTFVNSFLDSCWKKIEDINTPAIIRQACAAYIASIVARAKYIVVSTVKVCLELLTHWVHCYIDVHDASCSGPDAARHGPFYSVCQALFYMFVFRHRSLLDLEDGHKFLRRLNFERIITSRLNPLKVCLPNIVNLFAHVTRRYEILLCYTVIERNKRSMLPVATTQSNKAASRLTVFNQLDSFFPFDPYLLRRSGKFIKPLYQDWQGIDEETDIHDELNEQGKVFDSEDEEGEEYMEYGKTPDIDVPGLTPEMSMCISPGFSFSPIEKETRLHHSTHRVTKHKT
ncbi:RNA polymerase I-specific transcription initiation factor RRN3-like [Actinia tenebrosa]|uniref:RNA polymerase I-specific transcription initiation factor RRN3-like n=1 Tax=Actinia tenebrosa TaxID=6105 RepID=A0A6P8JC29_ACTTE|nr:RNA polymerase I-specific transcription initiation factor RRN3-like [Actinia tenebrosa]